MADVSCKTCGQVGACAIMGTGSRTAILMLSKGSNLHTVSPVSFLSGSWVVRGELVQSQHYIVCNNLLARQYVLISVPVLTI